MQLEHAPPELRSTMIVAVIVLLAGCTASSPDRVMPAALDAAQVEVLAREAGAGETAELYQQAIAGEVVAQRRLAEMYVSGVGVQRNLTAAVDWFSRAAEQDDCAASFALGMLYLGGRGLPHDLDEATLWLRRALDHREDCSS